MTRPTAVSRLWARTRKVLQSPNAEGLHTAGLLNLIWSDSAGTSLNESISYLRSAARLADRSSGVHVDVDLSAAYLVRAERTQNARDLLEAIMAAQRALELEPESPAARFNLALALDWFGLDGQALDAWKRYLIADSTSGWAEEARSRSRALSADPAPVVLASSASTAEVETYTARNPQEARLYGWDVLLGEWGEAVREGDTSRAGDRLRLAEKLGEALVRRGGDATLAEAVRAIRARSAEHAATRALAQAHVEYATAQLAYYDVDYAAARARFGRVLDIRPPSPHLVAWAKLFHAAMLAQNGELDQAERVLRPLTRSDTLRYPAFVGRSRWVLGTVLLRGGRYEAALEAAQGGARLLERSGEDEHQGGALYVAADAQFYLGATIAAHGAAHRALTTLRRRHRSIWLLNTLAVAARTAEADGLPSAAVRLQDERVDLAERSAHPARVAEARLGRARVLAAAGMLSWARVDIEASESLIDSLPAGNSRTWLETELRFARAAFLSATDPARAAANLDSVLAAPSGSLTAPRRLRAHIGRAEARLTLGDAPGATADLDSASILLAEERDAIAKTELRASLIETARGVFDRLTMLRIAAADTLGALRYLERGRTSFGPTGHGSLGTAAERWQMPAGEVAVEYALVGDTLLMWTVADTTVLLTRQTTDRDALIGSIEDLRSSLERGDDDAAVRRALTVLYDRLVAPVEAQLGDQGTTLVLVADGELASVPFSALYDDESNRYLVEAHPLRYAGSLRDATRTREHRPPRSAKTLLVADPAFDARVHPGLPRLPGARLEVDSIAALYSDHAVLADSGAGSGALEAALSRATVVHFAGHAVFDDQRPERSYLVLAPEGGAVDRGWLTAAEMEDLRLGHVDMLVLSACQTLRSQTGRSGGFAGFAGALLDAGAGGVVGSLWRVNDWLTTAFMLEFHRAYHDSGHGPRALQEAQLRLLRSSDPGLRSPAAWAGFRYAGN